MGDATTRFFDAMAASYDELEPWYEHLYAELHRIVRSALGPAPRDARALDAGCGTGFQTAILAELGYRPHGLDLSAARLGLRLRRSERAALRRCDLRRRRLRGEHARFRRRAGNRGGGDCPRDATWSAAPAGVRETVVPRHRVDPRQQCDGRCLRLRPPPGRGAGAGGTPMAHRHVGRLPRLSQAAALHRLRARGHARRRRASRRADLGNPRRHQRDAVSHPSPAPTVSRAETAVSRAPRSGFASRLVPPTARHRRSRSGARPQVLNVSAPAVPTRELSETIV